MVTALTIATVTVYGIGTLAFHEGHIAWCTVFFGIGGWLLDIRDRLMGELAVDKFKRKEAATHARGGS